MPKRPTAPSHGGQWRCKTSLRDTIIIYTKKLYLKMYLIDGYFRNWVYLIGHLIFFLSLFKHNSRRLDIYTEGLPLHSPRHPPSLPWLMHYFSNVYWMFGGVIVLGDTCNISVKILPKKCLWQDTYWCVGNLKIGQNVI